MRNLIPESFLQDLRDKNDVEDIISRYVKLKNGGGKLVGLCPFHSEKTPSFTIFPDTQSYYCFGCGAGGDIITFIRKIENLDYVDAVKLLAEQSGLQIPDDNGKSEGLSQLRDKILQMNKLAARFFYENLFIPLGKNAADYINKRQLSNHTVKHFGVGFAPNEWDFLLKHLKQNGFSEQDIIAGGLAVKNEKGGIYDRFRNRLMFPIIDVRGNVIAFGGRVMDDSMPKYLNSPDTLVFKKSLNLFALNFAKNGNSGQLLLAEGYMDVISMHQAGFTNAVATLGTAITSEQARLISRYANEVIIAYDADGAGQKATQKAIELLNAVNVSVKVLSITSGKDPDEYIRTFGADRFKLLLEGSGNHIMYRIGSLRAKYDLNSPDDTISFLRETADILSTVKNDIEREVYINNISGETKINKERFELAIKTKIRDKAKKQFSTGFKDEDAKLMGVRDKVNPQKQSNIKAAKAEEGLISLLIQNPNFFNHINSKISSEHFVTEFNRRVYDYICNRLTHNQGIDFTVMNSDFSPDEMGRIIGMSAMSRLTHMNTFEEADDYIKVITSEKEKPALTDVKKMSDDDFRESFKKSSKYKK